MEKQLESPLRKAIAFLEQHDYRYAVIGGIAVSQRGYVRFTHDVDLKVLVPNMEYDNIRDQLRDAFPERARPQVPANKLIVDAVIDGIAVDFLLALPGYDELVVTRATQRDLGGWTAWVCTTEDLIIQKVTAGRKKDWLDVEELLNAQQGKLDEAYMTKQIREFTELLERPELFTRYQRLLRRSKRLGD